MSETAEEKRAREAREKEEQEARERLQNLNEKYDERFPWWTR